MMKGLIMSYSGVPHTFYNGVVYTGRDFADAIQSGRQHLPRDVKDALAEVESRGADYPLYSDILEELRKSLRTTDSYNRVMSLPWDVNNLTRQLIGIIETAHRDKVPIPRPETNEEYQARAREPFKYGPHPRPLDYDHEIEQEAQRQQRMEDVDSDDWDDDRYYDSDYSPPP
jgi:hypothetical protein